MALQERAVSTRNSIIEGAAAVFESAGYGPASLQLVAEKAGVTRGSMYFHFKSKELLAHAVIDAQHEITQRSAERIVSAGHGPLETIFLLCADFAELLTSHPVVRAGIRLTLESSAFGHAVQDPYRDWMAVMEQLTARGQVAGEIREDIDPAAFSRFLVGSFTGVQMVSNVMTGRRDLMDRINEMSSLVRLMLMPEPGKALPTRG